MRNKYQISIPEPCEENWDGMKPTGLGRYCNSCEKNIQDFSRMTDNELVQLLISNKPHCGNFDAAQLDRVLKMDRRNLLPTLNLRAVAMGFGLLVTTSALATSDGNTRSSIDLIEVVKGTAKVSYLDRSSDADELCHFIVMDKESNLLSNAKLELLDDKGNIADVITTDANGMATYNRKMIKEMRIREIRVIPNSDDYERIVVPFEGADKTDHEVIQVEMKLDKRMEKEAQKRRSQLHIRGAISF
ncbi:MAG: hypothetical protein NXI10_06410 [bacterium]|nr:hypothetical protein [bacterium]